MSELDILLLWMKSSNFQLLRTPPNQIRTKEDATPVLYLLKHFDEKTKLAPTKKKTKIHGAFDVPLDSYILTAVI